MSKSEVLDYNVKILVIPCIQIGENNIYNIYNTFYNNFLNYIHHFSNCIHLKLMF